MSQKHHDPKEVWNLPCHEIGKTTLLYEITDSTNNRAADLSFSSGNHGVAILADAQTMGRGQPGRKWIARPCSSVLLSILLFPPGSLNRPSILTPLAACAVCNVVHRIIGKDPRIKWPNDVFVEGKKICGILIEQVQGVVIGIGMNVSQTCEDFQWADLPHATSLQQHQEKIPTTHEIAIMLLEQLDLDYRHLASQGKGELEERWIRGLGVLERDVEVECIDRTIAGKIMGISFERVEIRGEKGLEMIPPERIRHIVPR